MQNPTASEPELVITANGMNAYREVLEVTTTTGIRRDGAGWLLAVTIRTEPSLRLAEILSAVLTWKPRATNYGIRIT